MQRKKRSLLTLGAISVAIGLFAVLGVVQTQKASRIVALSHDLPHPQDPLPSIGGAFELVDQHGKIRTDTDFKGKPMLVYFGYTYCPDICPTALYNMTQVLEKLGHDKVIQPVFVTIDHDRDTTSQLHTYAQNFHKDFTMLTGTREQLSQAIKAYRVHAARVSEQRGDSDYLMDHSSIIYLMDKQGQYVTHFNHETLPEEMVKRIRLCLEKGE